MYSHEDSVVDHASNNNHGFHQDDQISNSLDDFITGHVGVGRESNCPFNLFRNILLLLDEGIVILDSFSTIQSRAAVAPGCFELSKLCGTVPHQQFQAGRQR